MNTTENMREEANDRFSSIPTKYRHFMNDYWLSKIAERDAEVVAKIEDLKKKGNIGTAGVNFNAGLDAAAALLSKP